MLADFSCLGGLTLVLDDLPDVNAKVESSLNWLKAKVHQGGKLISVVHIVTGAISLYMSVAISLSISFKIPHRITFANLHLTALTYNRYNFVYLCKKKDWLNIYN